MGLELTTIRPMIEDDLEVVVALEEAGQPQPWSLKSFRNEVQSESRVYLVAGDPIVAYGGFMIVGDEAHVTNLLVEPAHRRNGLGRRLMLDLMERAIAKGARHLTLEVRPSNLAARALYGGLGLVPVGIRPGYYRDEDALILWAHDIDRPGYLEGTI